MMHQHTRVSPVPHAPSAPSGAPSGAPSCAPSGPPTGTAWRASARSLGVRAVAVAGTLALGLSLTAPARADDVTDRKKEADKLIASLGPQLEGTNDKLAGAYVALEKTRAAVPVAQARLSAAQSAATQAEAAAATAEQVRVQAVEAEQAARAHNDEVAQKLAVARANEARAVEKLSASAQALTKTQDELDAYAAEVFQSGADQSQLALVFGSQSPGEFTDHLVMADTASEIASDTVDSVANQNADDTATRSYLTAVRGEVDQLKREAEEALRGAEAARAAADQAKVQADVAQANARTARDNAATAKSSLDSLQAAQTNQAADLASLKKSQESDLAAARAESSRLNAILVERARQARLAEQRRLAKLRAEREARLRAERAKAAAAAKQGKKYTVVVPPVPVENTNSGGFFMRPSSGPQSSGFGMRWHPVLQRWMLHDGLDFAAACGTPVYAAANGTIIRAGWRASGWGNQILIDHGWARGKAVVTSYNHLSGIVRWGGAVSRGQLIGYVGTTGYSTGCHLHFGVYADGVPVNPIGWL